MDMIHECFTHSLTMFLLSDWCMWVQSLLGSLLPLESLGTRPKLRTTLSANNALVWSARSSQTSLIYMYLEYFLRPMKLETIFMVIKNVTLKKENSTSVNSCSKYDLCVVLNKHLI